MTTPMSVTRRMFLRVGTTALLAMSFWPKKAQGFALIVKTIGSGGGRDYSTIQAWINALPANLVTDGNSYEGDCYNDSEFVATGVIGTFPALTTDGTHTVTLTTGAGQSFQDNASVRSNALAYNASNGVGLRKTANYNAVITFSGVVNYLTVSKLQMAATGVAQTYQDGVGNTNAVMSNCICESGAAVVLTFSGTFLINVLAVNRTSSGNGISTLNTNPTILGCTAVRPSDITATGTGYARSYGTPLVESCCSFGFTTAVAAGYSASSKNGATDQGSMIGTSNQVSVTYSGVTPFQSAVNATHDFRAIGSTSLAGNGFLDGTNAPKDISAYVRPAGPTIGAWQITTGGGGGAVANPFVIVI